MSLLFTILKHVCFEVFGHLKGEIALNSEVCLQLWFLYHSESKVGQKLNTIGAISIAELRLKSESGGNITRKVPIVSILREAISY